MLPLGGSFDAYIETLVTIEPSQSEFFYFLQSGCHMVARLMHRLGLFKLFERRKSYLYEHLQSTKCLTYVTLIKF